jgi:hypothetical protein
MLYNNGFPICGMSNTIHIHIHTPNMYTFLGFPSHRGHVICTLVPYFIQICIAPLFIIIFILGLICLYHLSLLFLKKAGLS